jgi:hypothetical protein
VDEFQHRIIAMKNVNLLGDEMVALGDTAVLHNVGDAGIFLVDGVVFRDLGRDAERELAELGAHSAIHALNTIGGLGNLVVLSKDSVAFIEDAKYVDIRRRVC